MATILDKDVLRESTVKYDDREIQVTLTADQRIEFKLKGLKSGVLSIGILELYRQLYGDKREDKPKGFIEIKPRDKGGDERMVSINTIRSKVLTTHMNMEAKLQLEGVLCEILKEEFEL
jgi:hypothetical protein